MRKPVFICCILLLFACHAYAQQTQKVTKDTLNYQERYHVLKSNPQVRQGDYMLLSHWNNKVVTVGYYINNKRDSVWREYDVNSRVVAEGHYREGKRVGEWKYYGDKWRVINKYDFDRHELTYHLPNKLDETHEYTVVRQRDTITTKLDRAPIYLGGDAVMYRPILYNIVYPPEARAKKIKARVLISFTLDEQGHTKNYHVDRPVGYGCDEEALRLVKQIPEDWIPGKLNGKNIAVILRIPVMFQ